MAKLRSEIARQKQDALSAKLLSDLESENLQKALAKLDDRIAQLEQ